MPQEMRISLPINRRIALFIATTAVAVLSFFSEVHAESRELLSLDGTWEIVFDSENEGREANWHHDDIFSQRSNTRPIHVPSCWELIEQDYEGVAFYRRKFEVPSSWAGKTVRLRFDAVNYLTEVWLNGEVVGFHEGGFTPFEFRVDSLLKPGKQNTLILRVVGPIILQNKNIDGVGPLETPQWRGGITGGVWQSVQLIATEEALVKDVFIVPKIENDTATFHLELQNTGSGSKSVQLVTTIRSANDPDHIVGTSVREVILRPGVSMHTETIQVPGARYWSPDDPHLYQADVELEGSDQWTSRFGMREFTIRDKQFYLNGEPIYLKATFFEGLYPNGIAYPDSREMAIREIQLAKEAGFNMIRPWRRPPAPMWLDLADELGVLVVGSPALECMRLPLSTPYLPARVEREVREAVLRDRNRACVVQWELFNELHRPILKQMMRPMALLTRELDPTRLILDESGGWAYGARMYLPNEHEPIRFNDIHNYPGPFINKRLHDGFLSIGLTKEQKEARGINARTPGRNVVPGLMSFVSELGYGSLPNLVDNNERFRQEGNPLTPAYRYHHRLAEGQRRVLEESGFGEFYPNLEQFCLDQQSIHGGANKRMIEAVRSNPLVSGYCIHALSAGDWIMGAGLIDLWRRPKSHAYEATKAANQPRILVIRMSPRNVYASRGSELQVVGVNEQASLNGILTVQMTSKSGETVFSNETRTHWNEGVSTLFTEQLDTQSLRGGYTITATLSAEDGSIVTENSGAFDVFAEQDLAIPKEQIAVLDLDGRLTRWLRLQGVDAMEFDASTPRSIPVFVTRVAAGTSAEQQRFADLMRFIRAGGTAVYVQGVGKFYKRGDSNQVQSSTVPVAARVQAAQGLWSCIPHLVREHPIFKGLPSGGMMRDIYENVWAAQSLRDMEVEPIVASIGFKWFSENHKLHYSGPGESWWGSDLAIVPHGEGRVIISQLRIVENLGSEPVADKLLFNLIEFTADN
ncbi:Beta-glucuronidase [Planctomycetes bacterium CA13]|uniref:Beta-glucuronidase n=2 Tax=Novipirellula herctigrandis TaxID=2527986 RepID=A0A5C5ZB18_9BACT|nr:Beta-glucuronidase [Planctomycetes bacterium CA13]